MLTNQHVNTKKIRKLQRDLQFFVDRLHMNAKRFESSFGVSLDPVFKADEKMLKKKSGELDKRSKVDGSYMAHGRFKRGVQHRMGMLGGALVEVSEACSTMQCSQCMTLHSPGISSGKFANIIGRHWLHHCPNKACKAITFRDEGAARAIGVQALVRCLVRINKNNQLNGSSPGSNGLTHRIREALVSA